MNLLQTTFLQDIVGFAALFYMGSFAQFICLIIVYYYEEKLDVDNLLSLDALVVKKTRVPKTRSPK